ncbi:MAG: family 16 glycosylhydrolase [Spirochaetales bacterium]|nr:family 16 glycosylhydrolase [Spirochaetales bacterium]
MQKINFTKVLKLFFVMHLIFAGYPMAAQSKGNIAPDQIPGVAVYIPFPVTITLDGKLNDWEGIPVQRVETGTKGPDKKQNQYFDFALAADEKNLYVYMHSEDSTLITGKHGKEFWNEDSMEFYVNFSNDLNAQSYGDGIAQITLDPTNIGNSSLERLSVSGINNSYFKVRAKVFKTADGWAFEAAVPFSPDFKPVHGKNIGFQAHANGASKGDRDSKLIWSKLDTSDQSSRNPAVFGRGVFFKIGSNDIPVTVDLGKDMIQTFASEGAVGKKGKKIVWSDEFNYSGAPEPKKWDYDAPDSGKWNQELQLYTSSRHNSFVKNGILTIRAIKDNAGKWTSARLFTKGRADWTYGYVEVRAKMPEGKGTWPAIWMMPSVDTYGSWPNSGEIDIMEFVGFEPDKVHTSAHTENYYWRTGTQKTRAANLANMSSEFHNYAIEWTPKGIFWYVDDAPFYYFLNEGKGSTVWPFDKPFYIILNLAIGGSWGGMKGVDESMKQADMNIDYVYVYK